MLAPTVLIKIGGEIIKKIWRADRKRWAGIFPDMVELTPCGDFQVCPKTGNWLREVAPQELTNHDTVPEEAVLENKNSQRK